MSKPAIASSEIQSVKPSDVHLHYTNDIEFDYLDAFLLRLKPRLSKLQEVLLTLIINISNEEAKGEFQDKVCRLSIRQYRDIAVLRMPGRKLSIDGVRHALKNLQDRGLIIKAEQWRWKNVFIPIDPAKGPGFSGIKIPIEVQTDPALHRTAKQVFGRIEYMLRDGKRIYIDWSNKRLAEDLGASEFLIKQAIQELKREKYIIVRNGQSKYREIGLHPEWKSIHAHLLQEFKNNRLSIIISERINSPKVERRLKRKGVKIQEENGQKLVVLPGIKGGSFAPSRPGKGGSFAPSRVVVLLPVEKKEPKDIIENNSDFEAPNKDNIFNKGIKDKKDRDKSLSCLPDGKHDQSGKSYEQEIFLPTL